MSMPKMPPVNFIRQLRMFNDGVPRRLRFWLIVLMALFYQFAGGVYLASLSQMVGDLGILSDDITMGSYCTLIGLNIIFPMMFRWKFGLYTRQLFFVSSIAIIGCNVVVFYTSTPEIFWIACLLAGYFKMMGMFGCMSTIQLNISPTRNFAVFFPVIYVLVCGAIQLSGLVTSYVTYFTNWRMMNLIIIAMMLILDAIVYFFMKHDHRSGPYLPLKGIDWLGQLLWTAVCVVGAWIFTFGEHYDWWESQEIWNATFIEIALIGITIIYSMFKREPYIDLKAFGYKATWILCALLMAMAVLQASAHVLQPTLLAGVLHYDALNVISLNYPELAGVVMGAILAYFILVRWKWGLRRYFFMTFFMMLYYLVSMYFIVGNETDKETMFPAMFALGVCEVMMETIATYYLSQAIPFPHFFTNITIVGFVRCGVGTAAGGAIVHKLFHWASTKHIMVASENVASVPDFATHGLIMALKECYGALSILCIIVMLFILIANFSGTVSRLVPRMMAVRRWMTHRDAPDPTL